MSKNIFVLVVIIVGFLIPVVRDYILCGVVLVGAIVSVLLPLLPFLLMGVLLLWLIKSLTT